MNGHHICTYELESGALCGRPFLRFLRHPRTRERLYLCSRHANSKRLAQAAAAGWVTA